MSGQYVFGRKQKLLESSHVEHPCSSWDCGWSRDQLLRLRRRL